MMPRRLFVDRVDAGQRLAEKLMAYREAAPLVLGLPRGGVPVAYEVARALDAPLDVWVVRKVGAPVQPELGMGAVAEGGETYLDPEIIEHVGATDEDVASLVAQKTAEVDDRRRRFRQGEEPPSLRDRTVIVVDDGVATGGTARAALRAIRRREPARLVFAVPVGSTDTLDGLRSEADDVVCLVPTDALVAIGLWYEDFSPTSDEDVIKLLDHARKDREATATSNAEDEGGSPSATASAAASADTSELTEGSAADLEQTLEIELPDAVLRGDLMIPRGAEGLVLFAHGSGSSRRSPRNRFVAEVLQAAGLGTLLFDLLTAEEEDRDAVDASLRFDIDLLAKRLGQVTDWARARKPTKGLPLGYFGASTGAAAALVAAAERPDDVGAVVSRGGRPDLAHAALARVTAPTLLLVGQRDREVLRLNRGALELLGRPKKLEIVSGATHLFEEPGTLEQVAELAAAWFHRYLARRRPSPGASTGRGQGASASR